MIEPLGPILNLQGEFETVRKQRQQQRNLVVDPNLRRVVRDAIFEAVVPDIRLALLPTIFRWEFSENFGGLLVVAYHREPVIARNQFRLVAFLEAVRSATGISHVVIAGGTQPVICRWSQSWVIRVRGVNEPA